MNILRHLIFAVVLLVALSACTPRIAGDFRLLNPDEVPEGKAAVYLFRPPSVIDESSVCNTMVGEVLVGGLKPGAYTVVFAEPGKTRFETVGTTPAFVTVNLNAKSEYFVRQAWHLRGVGAQPALDHLPKVKAESEIRWCSFIENPSPALKPEEEQEEDK